jgi:RNA polymerase sigma-70 factor (ECF subfamily)
VDRYPFDAEYLRRLREGDADTVRHFVEYFTERLTIKLWRRLAQPTIDDAIQETFVRVFDKLRMPNGIVSPECFGKFVFRVCEIYLLEQYRAGARLVELDDGYYDVPAPDPDVLQNLLMNERGAKALRTLDLMKPFDAQILRALYFEEQSKDEVCKRFGITREYLRVVLHRAIARFRFLFPKG